MTAVESTQGTSKFPRPSKPLERMSNSELHSLVIALDGFMESIGMRGVSLVNSAKLNRRHANRALTRLAMAGRLQA